MNISRDHIATVPPPIDLAAPSHVDTATFALG
jgi:hypothetical protein